MKNLVEISRTTGHILVPPPARKGCVAEPICETGNLRLAIKRVGKNTVVAMYPAQDQHGYWDFVIDDSLRLAKPGLYVGIIYCCNTPIHSLNMRLLRSAPGAPKTMDLTHEMCADPLNPSCERAENTTCPPAPCRPAWRRDCADVPCAELGSGQTPEPPPAGCSPPCQPCSG